MSYVTPKAFWPVTVLTPNDQFLYRDSSAVNHQVTVPNGTYFSAVSLAAALQTAIVAQGILPHMLVTVSSTGYFTFNDASEQFQMKSNAGFPVLASLLGITGAATGNLNSFVAPSQHQNGWYSSVAAAVDSLPVRDRASDVVTKTMAGQTKFISENELVTRQLDLKWLPPEKTYIAFEAGAGVLNTAIERLWQDGRSRFRYWPDGATEGTFFDYVLDYDTIKQFAPVRMFQKKGLYEVKLGIMGYVA